MAGRVRTMTEPNTSERQELLAKVSTAGQFFQVTNGGGPMNSNNALIAYAMRDMEAKAAKMVKQKQALAGFGKTMEEVSTLLGKKPLSSWRTWTVTELKLFICWKQGHDPKAPFDDQYKGLKKPQLQALFESKYQSAPDPVDSIWSEEDETKLKKLQNGEVDDFFVECGLQRAMDRDDEEITIRLKVKPASRRTKIIRSIFQLLERTKRQHLLDELALMIDADEDGSSIGVDSGIFADDTDDELDLAL